MDHIRRLAIYVDEPEPGAYYWVLHEYMSAISMWTDVLQSQFPQGTWRAAYDAGTAMFMRHVQDERFGPRGLGQYED